MQQLLALEQQPDAVFCSCDQMAIGALHALQQRDIRVPKTMKIIGFDDCSAARFVAGGITTIVSPYEDMLAVAVRILTQREQNRHSSHQPVAMRPELIIRATT
jgi:LacI family transcriptional regulator